jgi:PiT family inorganic phosphate transporter
VDLPARPPGQAQRGFRGAQTVSAIAMSVGHGMQDAAKTMGIIVLALYVGGYQDSATHIPQWVYYTSATVLALGTYAGGWRIIRTMGRKIIDSARPKASPRKRSPPAFCTTTRWCWTPDLDHPHDHLGDHGRRARPRSSPRCAGASPATS